MPDNITYKRVLARVPAGASPSAEDLQSLLVEAGVDADLIEIIGADNDEQGLGPEDQLVVVLETGATGDDEARLIEKAVRAGVCSIIGVWAPAEKGEDVHPVMRRYATAQVPWQASELADALYRDCHSPFKASQGQNATRQKVKANKCY